MKGSTSACKSGKAQRVIDRLRLYNNNPERRDVFLAFRETTQEKQLKKLNRGLPTNCASLQL